MAIGFQEVSIPFSYLDQNQKAIGYTVDICLKIVDGVRQKLGMPGVTVDFVPVTSSNRIPLLLNGTLDLNCASTTNNAEQQR